MEFTAEQRERYARQFVLAELGEEGQKKLCEAKVLVIGAGALGSISMMYLAAAGVGTIGIADGDIVEVTNLQRQIIHNTERSGMLKVDSASETLNKLNPEVKVVKYPFRLTEENIQNIIAQYDFIVDASDTFTSKYLINDACVRGQKPFVHAGIVRFEGQVMTYVPGEGPCFRCIAGDEPDGPGELCKNVGVLGAAVGVIGSIEAMEAIKYITGAGELLTGKMFFFDGLTMETNIIEFPEVSPECTVCNK